MDLLIILKHKILFFLIYLEEFRTVKHELSTISTSRNKAQKIVKFSFLVFSADFFKILPSKLVAL